MSCPVAFLAWVVADRLLSVSIPDIPSWAWMSVGYEIELWPMIYLGEHRGESLVEFDEEPSHSQIHLTCSVVKENKALEAADNVVAHFKVLRRESFSCRPPSTPLRVHQYLSAL